MTACPELSVFADACLGRGLGSSVEDTPLKQHYSLAAERK